MQLTTPTAARRFDVAILRRFATPEVVVALVLLALPLVVRDDFTIDRLGRFAVLAVFALSADLLWGVTGMVSFGHAVFFGSSAYAVAIAQDQGWVGTPVALPTALAIGVAASVVLAAVLAVFSFSARRPLGGVYFAIVTLIVAVVAERLAHASYEVTGGRNGLFLSIDSSIAGTDLAFGSGFYGFAVALLASAYLFVRWVTRGRLGRSLLALRENEDRLRLLGYDTARLKATSLLLSAALAGAAGVVYFGHDGLVSPGAVGISQSIFVLLWVLIGGVGTLVGPVVGAMALSMATAELSGRYLDTWLVVVGVLLVVTLLVLPRGIFGRAARPEDRLRRPT